MADWVESGLTFTCLPEAPPDYVVAANLVYAGPTSGPPAAPSFRYLVWNDIKDIDFSSAPTSDPGGGKIWINGNYLCVGS